MHAGDARSNRVQVLDPSHDRQLADPETRTEVRIEGSRAGCGAAVICLLLLSVLLIIIFGDWMIVFDWRVVAAVAVMGVLVLLAQVYYPVLKPSDVVRAWLAHGRCASCGYAISDLPREADGCTVCPECGAAWELPERATP